MPAKVTGVVRTHVFEADGRPLGPSTHTLLRGKTRRVPVAADARLMARAKLKVVGMADATGVLHPETVKMLRLPARSPAYAVEHLLVLPLDFADLPAATPIATLTDRITALAATVAAISYGHTRIVVHPQPAWRRAAVPAAAIACSFADALAAALAAYPDAPWGEATLVNVVLPEIDWTAAGCTSGGAAGAYIGRVPVQTPIGIRTLGVQITGETWAASLHETGHSLGLEHANALHCPEPLPATLDDCTSQEYGDPFDTMGWALGDFGALRKRQLGWLSEHGPTLERWARVEAPGTYVLHPIETAATDPETKLLLLPRATVPPTWLALHVRQAVGIDAFLEDGWLAGVFLHAQLHPMALGAQTLSPVASHLVYPHQATDWEDVALRVDEAFAVDPWTVAVTARDPATGIVTVQVDVRAGQPTPAPTASPIPCTGFQCPICCAPGDLSSICYPTPLRPACPCC